MTSRILIDTDGTVLHGTGWRGHVNRVGMAFRRVPWWAWKLAAFTCGLTGLVVRLNAGEHARACVWAVLVGWYGAALVYGAAISKLKRDVATHEGFAEEWRMLAQEGARQIEKLRREP